MKSILTLTAVAAFAAACLSIPAQAQLLTYTFPGAGIGTPVQPTINTNGPVTGQAGVGSGLGLDSNGNVTGYQAHGNGPSDTFPATLAASEAANAFYTFTITPDSGDFLDLTALDLSSTTFFYQLTAASSSYTVMVSSDGFTTPGTLLDTYSPASDSDNTVQGTKLTLSGLSQVKGPVEFRVYTYGQPGDYFLASLQGSLSIDGSAKPLPEPSAWALLLVGAVALGILRRRSGQKA